MFNCYDSILQQQQRRSQGSNKKKKKSLTRKAYQCGVSKSHEVQKRMQRTVQNEDVVLCHTEDLQGFQSKGRHLNMRYFRVTLFSLWVNIFLMIS